MAAKSTGFSIADIQQGVKKLNSVPVQAEGKSSGGEHDPEALHSLEDLYNKYDGDLDKIFGDLRADPSKAKKPHHRPKDAKEFAKKYLEGFYSLVEDESDSKADAKSHK